MRLDLLELDRRELSALEEKRSGDRDLAEVARVAVSQPNYESQPPVGRLTYAGERQLVPTSTGETPCGG